MEKELDGQLNKEGLLGESQTRNIKDNVNEQLNNELIINRTVKIVEDVLMKQDVLMKEYGIDLTALTINSDIPNKDVMNILNIISVSLSKLDNRSKDALNISYVVLKNAIKYLSQDDMDYRKFHFNYARLLVHNEMYQDALNIYGRILEKIPNHPSALGKVALILSKLGRQKESDEILDIYNQVIKRQGK